MGIKPRFSVKFRVRVTDLSSRLWWPETPTYGGTDARANYDAERAAGQSQQAAKHASRGGIFRPYPLFLFPGKRRPGCRVPVSGGASGAIALVTVARHTRWKKIITVITATLGTRTRVIDLPRTALANRAMIYQRQFTMA
jgi:hypothetical protein